jgi:hypothetical protein
MIPRLKVYISFIIDNFVRLTLKVSSPDKADKLTESINNFYKTFKTTIVG